MIDKCILNQCVCPLFTCDFGKKRKYKKESVTEARAKSEMKKSAEKKIGWKNVTLKNTSNYNEAKQKHAFGQGKLNCLEPF